MKDSSPGYKLRAVVNSEREGEGRLSLSSVFVLCSGAMRINGGGEWRYMKFPDPGYMWVMGEMVIAENKKGKVAFCYIPPALVSFFFGWPGPTCMHLCLFLLQDSTRLTPLIGK